jgi:5'-AMP-activated protein kinase regulatory beta subunit
MLKPKAEKTKPKRRRITFMLEAAGASNVCLVGDFNDWNTHKHPMTKNAQGQWTKQVLLAPGEFEYKFLVDGRWLTDPDNRRTRLNDYGTFNSVIAVTAE